MNDDVFVGLDVHRKTIAATVLDREGNRIDRRTLEASDAELVRYLASLPGKKHIALEACNVWEHVYDAAKSTGAEVRLAHPKKTRLIAEANLSTDKVDSGALAELMRLNGIAAAYAPDKPTRDLRQLVRDRRFYKEQETAIKNHAYACLLRRGIEYEDGILGLKRKRESLREQNLPVVDRALDMLRSIEETCKGLDDEIHAAFLASKEAQLLESIPGIGELSAVTLVAEVCPISRFPNIDKFCAYVGLVPTTYQSGDNAYRGHLVKDCNSLAKTILVECAWSHRLHAKNSDVSRKGRRVSRRRGKNIGIVAAAHHLARITYAVLRRGTPYTPERPRRDMMAT